MVFRDAIEKTVILAVGDTFGAAPLTGSKYTNNRAIKQIDIILLIDHLKLSLSRINERNDIEDISLRKNLINLMERKIFAE